MMGALLCLDDDDALMLLLLLFFVAKYSDAYGTVNVWQRS